MQRKPLPAKRTTPRIQRPERIAHVRQKRRRGDRNAAEDAHIARVAAMPCLISGQPAEVHHLLLAPGKRAGRDHRWIVPLSPYYHRQDRYSVHGCGSEALFEWTHNLPDGFLIATAKRLWDESEAMRDA